ncbi:MAG: hypothetical protein LBH57_09660, partial [Treponema sp.]|nr:hypothetical protein [Treponema sp.]
KVIPEGFRENLPEDLLVESEDTPAPEEILENADDSFIIDDDILDIDDIPDDDLSVRPEAGEEINAEDILIGGGEEEAAEERSAGEAPEEPDAGEAGQAVDVSAIPPDIRNELRSVLSYMDQLLESLPEDKIEEFAKSEQFDTYKKLFEELGLA